MQVVYASRSSRTSKLTASQNLIRYSIRGGKCGGEIYRGLTEKQTNLGFTRRIQALRYVPTYLKVHILL